jgi:hypothetical protein
MKRELLLWGIVILLCTVIFTNYFIDHNQYHRIAVLQNDIVTLKQQLYSHITDTTAFHNHPDPTKLIGDIK